MAKPDAIWGVTDAFNQDTNPKKINVGFGVYRDDNGQPYVFTSVLKVRKHLASKWTWTTSCGLKFILLSRWI